jgi:hypothetical protein
MPPTEAYCLGGQNRDTWIYLIIASHFRHDAVAKFLIEKGAEIKADIPSLNWQEGVDWRTRQDAG